MIHVTALEDMAAKLIDLGISITEHDLITTIICSISPVRYESLLGAWENVPYAERTMMPCEIDFFWFKNDLYDVKWMRGLLNVSHHQQMVTTTRLCKLLEVIGDTSTVDFAVDEPVKAH